MTNNFGLSDNIRINGGPSKVDNSSAKDPALDPKQQRTKPDTSSENQRLRNTSSGNRPQGTSTSRDPAVSISPSIAPHKKGDIITSSVDHLDAEGRRVIETSVARYILKVDSTIELAEKQRLKLVITATDRTLRADITEIDDQKLEKPIPATLTILTLHEKAASHLKSLQQVAKTRTDIENLAKNITDPAPEILEADSYQIYDNQQTLATSLPENNQNPEIIASVVTASQASNTPKISPLDHTLQHSHSSGGGIPEKPVASANALISAALPSPQLYGQPLYRFAAQLDIASQENKAAMPSQSLTTGKYSDLASSTSEGAALLKIAQDDLAGKITVPLVTPALNAAGKSVSLTLVDPSLSTVQSLRLERILDVQSQSVENLKHVPAPAHFLSQAKDLPSTITTDSGRYLVSGAASTTLIGQLVNVQALEINQNSENSNTDPASGIINHKGINQQGIRPTVPNPATTLYTGQFIPLDYLNGPVKAPSAVTGETVNLQIQTLNKPNPTINPDEATKVSTFKQTKPEVPLGSLPIDSVRIINSYLGPKGPTSDIILQTVIGKIALTLPSANRPIAGDFVQISGLYPPLSPLSGAGVSNNQSSGPPANVSPNTQVSVLASSPVDLQQDLQKDFSETPPEDLVLTIGNKIRSPLFAPLIAQHPVQSDKSLFTVLEDAIELSMVTGSPEVLSSISARSAEGGARLTSSLLFFLSALGKKNPKLPEILGKETEQALKEKSQASVRALAADLPRLSSGLRDIPTGEWRQFPFLYDARDGVASLLSFMIKQEDKGEDTPSDNDHDADKDGHKVTDFMVEIDYSLMGNVRLDGRVTGSHFDLIVTVSAPLSQPLKSDLAGLFYSANDANGFTGSLIFKTTPTRSGAGKTGI